MSSTGLVEALADPAAPTSVHGRKRARNVHIADSLTALEVPGVREAERIADLGAGAGLPGLVLAIALPDAEVALVESVGKKCAWMEATVEELGLTNARWSVRAWRSGRTAAGRRRGDRAGAGVAAVYASTRRRCCARAGSLVAWKGAVARPRTRMRSPRRRRWGSSGTRCFRCSPSPARSGARCTSSARSRPRRSAIRDGREWPQNAR